MRDLVLFDWERFGQGSPAIDLAPLVQGLGTHATFSDIAARYLRSNQFIDDNTLLQHLILAKVWIVIEVVNLLVERENLNTDKYIDYFDEHLPRWLEKSIYYLQ